MRLSTMIHKQAVAACGSLMFLYGCSDGPLAGGLAETDGLADTPADHDMVEEEATQVCAAAPTTNPLVGAAIGGEPLCGRLTVFAIDSLGRPIADVAIHVEGRERSFERRTDATGRAVFEDEAMTGSLMVEAVHHQLGFTQVHGIRAAVASLRLGPRHRPIGTLRGLLQNPESLGRDLAEGQRFYASVWCVEPNPWVPSWTEGEYPAQTYFSWGSEGLAESSFTIPVYLNNCVGLAVTGGTRDSGGWTPRRMGLYFGPMPSEGETLEVDLEFTHDLDQPRSINLNPGASSAELFPFVELPSVGVIWLEQQALPELAFNGPASVGDLQGATWGVFAITARQTIIRRGATGPSIDLPAMGPTVNVQRIDDTMTITPSSDTDIVGVHVALRGVEGATIDGAVLWLGIDGVETFSLANLPVTGGIAQGQVEAFSFDRFDTLAVALEDFGRAGLRGLSLWQLEPQSGTFSRRK